MTATATKRFVNLGKSRTIVPGPNGGQVIVHPFEDSLDPRTRRADATYVLEGDFWSRYATGQYSQLHPFPRPSQFGRTTFPTMAALRDDGSTVDVASDDVDAADGGQHVAARPGTPRIAADVITPEGKIRRTLPNGEIELLDDTPENRNMVHSDAGVVTDRNPGIKDGILAWLEKMHIESYADFAALGDDVLLKIPGVTAASLPHIRKNLGDYLRKQDELEEPEETPVGESASTATQPRDPIADQLGDDDEEEEDEPPTPARKAKKKVAKKKAKKKVAKKAAKKKAAKKKTTRRKASD